MYTLAVKQYWNISSQDKAADAQQNKSSIRIKFSCLVLCFISLTKYLQLLLNSCILPFHTEQLRLHCLLCNKLKTNLKSVTWNYFQNDECTKTNRFQVIRTKDRYSWRKQKIRVVQTVVPLEKPLRQQGMSKPHFIVIKCDLSSKISNVAMAYSYGYRGEAMVTDVIILSCTGMQWLRNSHS